MLKRAAARVEREMTEDVASYRPRQLTQLKHLYRQAMRGGERSKEDGQRERRKTVAGPGATEPRTVETIITTWTRCDAPAFLNAALGALAGIRELLGLNAPPGFAWQALGHGTPPPPSWEVVKWVVAAPEYAEDDLDDDECGPVVGTSAESA
jgi:hypothetical protein